MKTILFNNGVGTKNMNSNIQIVLKAAKQDGWSLQFAADHLKSDKDVVLEAVKQNGDSLE